jgi:fructose-specific component phosphotransferase system IIB-like protein
METPHQLRSAASQREDVTITHREYDDENVIVIDFGPSVEADLDIVGETAIVVAGDQQYEFDVPTEASEITTNDGMLLIKES